MCCNRGSAWLREKITSKPQLILLPQPFSQPMPCTSENEVSKNKNF